MDKIKNVLVALQERAKRDPKKLLNLRTALKVFEFKINGQGREFTSIADVYDSFSENQIEAFNTVLKHFENSLLNSKGNIIIIESVKESLPILLEFGLDNLDPDQFAYCINYFIKFKALSRAEQEEKIEKEVQKFFSREEDEEIQLPDNTKNIKPEYQPGELANPTILRPKKGNNGKTLKSFEQLNQ